MEAVGWEKDGREQIQEPYVPERNERGVGAYPSQRLKKHEGKWGRMEKEAEKTTSKQQKKEVRHQPGCGDPRVYGRA